MDPSRENLSREKLKQTLLMAFVLIGIILVMLIWREALAESSRRTPAYVRFTPLVGDQTPAETAIPAVGTEAGPPEVEQTPPPQNLANPVIPIGTSVPPQKSEPTMSLMDQ